MGAYLPAPQTAKTFDVGETFNLRYAAASMQGWRLTNEDAFLVNANLGQYTSCFGVFDGHSGAEVARFTAKNLPSVLTSNQRFHSERLEVALQETFIQMDERLNSVEGQQELIRLMKGLPDDAKVEATNAHSISGSTACVGVIRGSQLILASVGDSRAVVGQDGATVELTTDHKPTQAEERRRIRKAGGSVEDNRVMGNLNLSRSIGDLDYKRNSDLTAEEQMVTANPDVKTVELSKDVHFLVIACDGVWDMLSPQECVKFVYERLNKQSVEKIVTELLDHCIADDVRLSGGLGCDNLTCILIQFKNR